MTLEKSLREFYANNRLEMPKQESPVNNFSQVIERAREKEISQLRADLSEHYHQRDNNNN